MKGKIKRIIKKRTLLFMCIPAIVYFFVFSYLPLPGVWLAFVRYNYKDGIFRSPFVGLDNFRFLVLSGQLWTLTRNTILYNLAFIITGNILQVTVAILFNEMVGRRLSIYKKISQSIMFLPYFISSVVIGVFAYNLLNVQTGFINSLLKQAGRNTINFYSIPEIWPFIIVLAYLWQNTGYGSIVYFAAIMGIDSEMLEASEIDGANAFQRIRYIILPCLKPTFVILLLFALGGIMKGNFGLFYNLTGANNMALFETTDIIETFVFRSLNVNFNFSMGSAVGLYQSLFGFILVMTVNTIVKKIDPEYSLF
ncbi:ABC-type polysaccharide transport system, permease component [Thermoclostridium stercorarium subsp. stercorarium DSM 8532]|jgi:putative aldouronate transport system permease protein|uniref:ABC-type polysaccharide transport system, permease component n=3 Tax=Thermoclostridium stercorarium TaxID=1510 RepID=L7VH03_THES1|nr:ABC transporter permease subunit [Thermoclostridium stercorarium]AGC67265.1 ABC-type polysaccharide transport system, permease component [Thermoclostridium stercorarium subsp. stercorarium DSM 8532]AGI38334.1 ABC transporter permease subunit [Thermoclostridium stercorarium subsp. stercorarium DSM 8532]ANW97770.1 sugar ABC transporter permease [Thermoclostridium stercorarium subsp. thermolacticum DSM 2910]ANX00297.1 sugar ABC transporter permease [Thermoclostridium stercorarium subsp. leptosp